MRKERKSNTGKEPVASQGGTKRTTGRSRGFLARILGVVLAATLGVGIGAAVAPNAVKETEVYAKEIGVKNETQQQGCEGVVGGQPPAGYTDELSDGSVFRGGTSFSGVGSKDNALDQDANDFARPLPYGDTYVDTNKLNWDNPDNFIIDIKDERFVWVSTERIEDPNGNVERSSTVKFFLKEATRTDKLGNTSTSDPFNTGKIVGGINGGTETFIAYMGPLESYLPNITDNESSDGYTNIIKAPEGSYLYRITYLDAVTLPNGTRGNLVITMKEVKIESSFEVNKNNPNIGYDEDGNELYKYENALIQIQAPNQMGIDVDLKDNDNQWINKLDEVVKTADEVEAVYKLTNEKLTSGKYTDKEIADASVDQTVRHAAGALLDFDLEVVDSEGKPVEGTISYAAHDLDFDTKQNIWGRSVDDDKKYLFSEGLKIVEGSKSYALVPNYNHADGVDRASGWIPVSPQKTDAGYSVNNRKETAPLNVEPGNGNNADGVRFSSKGITKIRDKNGTFKDVPFMGGQIAVDKGYQYTASQAPILHSDLANKTTAASGNGLRSNAYRKIFYGKLVEGGYTGTVNGITLKDMHDYWLGNGSYKLERTDPIESFDTGFAVLLDAKKSSLQWSGSRQSGAGINTTLFDSSIYTYVEPTHGAGGGIYIESYDINNECATKMVEGSTVMGRNSEVTVTAVPEEGYRVGRILIGDTNYGKDPGARGLQDYITYTIDGNELKIGDQVMGWFTGDDIDVKGHEGLKTGIIELDGFNFDRDGNMQPTDPMGQSKKIIIERNADGTVDVTLPDIDNPMHVHADFDTYYYFYKVWKDGSKPETLTMTAAPAGVYPVSVTIPMPTGEVEYDEETGTTTNIMEMVDFEISGSTYHALNGVNAGVDFVLSPNNTVEYVEYETDPDTGEVTEKFAIRSNVILMGNEFVHQTINDDGDLVIDARYPVTIDTSVADWDSDDAKDFVIDANDPNAAGYVTELDVDNEISPGNKVWVVKYPSEGVSTLNWPALPVEMLPKDDAGNIIDNHEAANHTDRYYWFVTEEVPAWSTESYSNEKAKNPGVIHDPEGKPGYYKDSAWVAASLKDTETAQDLIHEDNEYSYAYMSVFENGGEITNEPSIVIRGKKDWQSDFDNKYETREDIWLHLDVKITNPADGSTIVRKDMLPPQMVSKTALGSDLAKHWGTKASYPTGDKNIKIVGSTNKVPGNAKLQAVDGKKVYTGPYKYTRKGTTTYYYINELKEKDADGKTYEYSIRETLDWEGNQPVEKDNIDAGLLGYTSEDVADWTEISANEDTYIYKYKYNGENRTTEMKRYTGTVENKYELMDFTVTKKWIDNKDDADHTADQIKDAVTLYDTDGEVDLEAMGQYTTTVTTDAGETEEALGTMEVTTATGKEFTLTWKHLPKYIRDASGNIVYAGYYATEDKAFDGYTAPMYSNVDEPGTPDVDESKDDAKAFNNGLIVNAQKIKVNVEKVWDDADNQDGLREDIKVTLFQNGLPYETEGVTGEATLKEADATVNGDTWTWENVWGELPYADASGTKYNYTAQETSKPDGYDSDESVKQIVLTEWNDAKDTLTFTATNKHDPETIDFTITKVWDDDNDHEGFRPKDGEVKYTIKADGTALTADELEKATIKGGEVSGTDIKAKTTGTDGDKVTVEGLPKNKKAGQEIEYTIEEAEVAKYTTEISGDQSTGFTVTNVHTPETVDVTVNKVWDDAENQDGKRPNNVVFTLVADEIATELTKILNEDNDWTATFKDLDKYKAGVEIIYTVIEELQDDLKNAGYTASDVAGKGTEDDPYTITNKYTPEQVTIKATKVWDDEDNKYGLRKDAEFTLMADGKKAEIDDAVKTIAKDATGDALTVAWTVDKYKNGGTEIAYTVTEGDVALYTSEVSGDAENGFTITNTYEPEEKTTNVTRKIEYKYIDENGEEASKTVEQTVELKRTPKTVDPTTGEVTEWNDWEIVDDKDNKEVESPEIEGWTPDETSVPPMDIDLTKDDPKDGIKDELVIYTPEDPTGTPDETWGGKNEEQTGTPTFDVTTKKTPAGEDNKIESVKLIDPKTGKPTDEKTVDAVDKDGNKVGTYTLNDDGTVTFTPEKDYVGDPEPLKLQGTDTLGGTAETTYTPHVVDNTKTEEVTRTIEYEYNDGTPVVDKDGKPVTKVETLKFTNTGTVDPKTGEVTYKDEDWKPETTDKFDKVTSPTEENPGDATNLNGWTPERDVDEKTVKATDDDIFEKVIYTPEDPTGTPDETWGGKNEDQTGTPTFDVTTKKTPTGEDNKIESVKLIDPKTGEPTDEKTVDAVDKDGNKVGTYTLNDDGTVTFTPEKDYVGDPEPLTLEGTDSLGGTATTTYTPHVVDNVETEEVTRTIEYEYNDGTPVVDKDGNPIVKEETLKFTRTGTVDPKTGKVTYKDEDWKPETTDKFDEVTSPTEENPGDATNLKDWTPDRNVDEKTVKATDDDIYEKVIYNPKGVKATPDETYGLKGEPQTGNPDFKPETELLPDGTKNEIAERKLIDPQTGDPVDEVKIPGQGTYKMNPDGTVTFTPEPDFVGDPSPVGVVGTDKLGNTAKTTYTPHVVDPEEKGTATRTIHYTYLTKDGEEVTEDTVQTVTLIRKAKSVDPKTGEVTEWGDWSTGELPAVTNPDDKATRDGKYWTTDDKVDKLEVTEPGDKGTEYVVYTYETMDITAKKVWDDNDDQDGKRPNNVVFNLVADGIATKLSEILNKDNGWTATFTALDKYKSGGTEIIYTVVEALKDDLERAGYTADESEADKDGGYTITNKYTPEQVTIKATKVWDDLDNKYGLRKDVTFTLMADGTAVADSAQTIAKDATGDALTVEWTVDKYRNGGTEINYTVTESNVSPYSQAVTGDAENGFIITNTYPPVTETTEVTRTIIYTYLTEDGQEASETVTQTVKLQRVPTVIDEAGGVVEWSDWEILEGDTDEVTSPEIEGWTPDRATVEEWDIEYDDDGRPMNATEHVVYQPQPPTGTPDETYGGKGESQTGMPAFEVTTPTTPDGSKNEIEKIELLDEDGNPTDTVEVPEGTYTLNPDGTITFTPNDPEYVGDPTPVNVRGTDKNGLTAETTYTPHIVDNVETEEVTRTIEYEYYDGTKVVDENGDPITKTETLKFTRTGTVDPKTGEITYKDEDWKADTTDTFDEVVSPTEDEPGDATNLKDYVPDRDSVDSKTVKATDDDIYEKVIYNHKDLIPTPDETYGLKNQPQTGEPKFDLENDTTPGGDPNVIEDRKLIDPSTGEPTDEPVKIEGQGTYTLNEDGTITFTPEEDFVGNPTPIGVIGTDTIGNKAKTTYTPHVVDPEEKGTATRTIHYTYLTKDGEEVTEDTKQSVELTRKAAKIDPKTGEVTEWGAWSKETLPSVDNPDDKATKDGKTWTTTDKVEDLEVTEPGDKGVVNVVYQAAPVPPEKVTDTTTVTRKIEYKYYDENGNEASKTITQTVELKRTAKKVDPETGEATEWNDWEIVDDKDNKAVDSPEIEGWNPDRKNVPPMDIDLTKDDPQEGIKDELVVYTPEPPVGTPKKTYGKIGKPQSTDAKKLFEVTTPTTDTGEPNEIVKIELIDPETGEPAKTTVDPETGKTIYGPIPAYGINPETGEREQVGTYELDPETGIVTFKPNETFTGTPEPATLKATDKNGLDTTTTYTPNIPDKRQKVTVDREITYMYKKADGTEAPVLDEKGEPVKVVQTVTFVRETNVDPETGELTWTDWEPEEAVMGKVVSPTEDKTEAASGQKATDLEGWTPDKDVDEFKVTIDPETEQPFEPADDVVYYICGPVGSDKETWGAPGEQQKGTPKFTEGTGKITKYELTDPDPDDPNKKTVPGEGTYVLNPETGEITFTPEDGFTGKGTGVTVKATDENGKTAEGKYNPNVPEPETQTGKRTITYLYDDGTPVLDENGNPIVEEQIEEFTRTPKKVDPETGEVTEWNEWDKKDYPEKDSPEVDGYTPNKDKVDEDSAKPGDNKEEIVIYKKTSTDPTRETETETVKRVIHYRYLTRDGKIADEDVEQTVTFTREKVTSPEGEVTYTEWQVAAGDKNFAEVPSPVKTGYDVDREKVDAVSVAPETEDMEEWVIYTPTKDPSGEVQPPVGSDKETYGGRGQTQSDTPEFTPGTGKIPEKGAYTLEDPDADNPLKKTVPGEGVYTLDPDTGKVTFEPEPDFVGDGTGVTVKVTDENGLTATGKYTPHVVDNVQKSTATKTVQYYYNNGEPVPEDIAPTQTQEIEFERTGEVDPKTGKITKWNDWTPSEFDKVDSPKVDGFTPNKESVEAEPANPGDNVKDIVIYVPEDEIIEETQTKTITRIIKYRYLTQDGEEAFADVKQTVTFSRIKTTNKTTGEETHTDWIPTAEEMEAVDSPVLDNYNVDRASVDALTIDPDEYENGRVIEEYVIYTPKTIWVTYVDEDGKTIYLEKTTEPKAGKGQKQEEPDAPADPVKEGYVFKGWDRTVDEEGNITYIAKWEPEETPEPVEETIWVTYIDPDGTVYLEKVTEPKAKDGETQEEPDAPADPAKEGYVFKGWDRTVDEEGNITYIAKWEPEETPEPVEETIWVTYIDPDGTVYLEKVTEPKAKDGETQEEPDAPADPVKEGYVFKGWDRTVDEEGNITYIAKWEPVGTDPADPTTPTDTTDDSKSDGNTPGQSGTQPDPGVDRKTVIDPNTGRQISVVTPSGTKTPGTGDRNNSLIWIIAAVAAAGAGVTAVVIRRRKRED